jgi:uncharacterized protein
MDKREILIPGGEGRAFEVKKGEYIIVTDVKGKQVADLVCLNLANPQEYLSTAHTRMMVGRTSLTQGDTMYTNYRNAILEMVVDKVGVHDTLYPCCDPMRYKLDFGLDEHRNCRDNLAGVLQKYGVDFWRVPDPVNLFQNSPLNVDGSFADAEEPKTMPGDYVVLKALMDVVVGISACPQDMIPLNGWIITDIKAELTSKL